MILQLISAMYGFMKHAVVYVSILGTEVHTQKSDGETAYRLPGIYITGLCRKIESAVCTKGASLGNYIICICCVVATEVICVRTVAMSVIYWLI